MQVFDAPHIRKFTTLVGAKVSVQYTLRGDGATSAAPQFVSNVRYEHPLLGAGWLSASGTLTSNSPSSVLINFDRFWCDGGGEVADLRPWLAEAEVTAADKVITALGRVAFFHDLATFPVLHLDAAGGVAVFRFPPLDSNIAVVKV